MPQAAVAANIASAETDCHTAAGPSTRNGAARRGLGWSVLAGLLLGYCVMMSYGLPLLGVLAIAVLVVARSWYPLVPAALAALAVVLVFAVLGFSYLEALPAIRDRYYEGVGGRRPWASRKRARLSSATPAKAIGPALKASAARSPHIQ